jgi:TPP-dependent pyruvate/acetoin dehydrogenase alpha subunit
VRLLGQLKAQGAMTDADWQAMDGEVLADIEAAVAYAAASPFPKPEHALEDMYAA